MFKKFKEMILETLIQGEARFQVEQDKSRALFRDPNETPAQVQQRLKEINDMINPKEFARQVELLNSGVISKDPTLEQIRKNQKDADDQAIMLKTNDIRNEVKSWGDKAQTKVVLEIVADTLKTKAIDSMKSVREKAFGVKSNDKDNSFKLN